MWDAQKGEEEASTASLLLTTVLHVHGLILEGISNCSGAEG